MHQNSNGNYSGSRLGWLSSSLLISVFPILFLQQTLNSLCNKRGKAHYNHPEGLKTNAEELVNKLCFKCRVLSRKYHQICRKYHKYHQICRQVI